MKCPHCGRENETNMLFCAFCGEPLEEDEPGEGAKLANAYAVHERPVSDHGGHESDSSIAPKEAESLRPNTYVPPRKVTDADLFEADDAHIGTSRTIIPRRQARDDDIFLDDSAFDADVDLKQKAIQKKSRAAQKSEEDPLPSRFLQRHIRGIVSLALIAFVALILFIWAASPGGQRTLSQLNISRNPVAYANLAAAYGESGSREMEGYYYSRALQFDRDNLNYAVGMANAYIASGNTVKATEALLKIIAMDENNTEAYVRLSNLYPVASTRSDVVRSAIDQGYRLTGDSRLKQ